MTVQVEEVVTHVSVRVEQPEPDFLTSARREHRRLRVTTDEHVREHVGEVEVTSRLERSLRRIAHALPEWFSAVVDRFLSRVFSVFRAGWTTKVRHRTAVG